MQTAYCTAKAIVHDYAMINAHDALHNIATRYSTYIAQQHNAQCSLVY